MKTETGEIISKKEALVREAMECGFQRFEAEAFYNCLRRFQQRPWVGLTDDEIKELRFKTLDAVATNYEVYRAIEAKLKEKNS